MATGEPLPDSAELKTPLLGVANGIAVYLLFNGILGDRSVNGGNILTREILASLPPHEGTRIIYGNGCRISPERLRRENIIFRQVPYEVRVP
jgi:site-specific DNA-methyltransferase (adenine-specific)/adenine-specific DNA-methyltransferase